MKELNHRYIPGQNKEADRQRFASDLPTDPDDAIGANEYAELWENMVSSEYVLEIWKTIPGAVCILDITLLKSLPEYRVEDRINGRTGWYHYNAWYLPSEDRATTLKILDRQPVE